MRLTIIGLFSLLAILSSGLPHPIPAEQAFPFITNFVSHHLSNPSITVDSPDFERSEPGDIKTQDDSNTCDTDLEEDNFLHLEVFSALTPVSFTDKLNHWTLGSMSVLQLDSQSVRAPPKYRFQA